MILEKYHYGGMAFRGRDEWFYEPEKQAGKDTLEFLTSKGKSTRSEVNHTTPKWICMYGTVGERKMSLTVIPGGNNINYPEFVRVHPDLPYFCFTPIVQQSYTLKPGTVFKANYRVVTTADMPSADLLNKIEKDSNRKGY